jgi:membrane associated rhomboid family serine protease
MTNNIYPSPTEPYGVELEQATIPTEPANIEYTYTTDSIVIHEGVSDIVYDEASDSFPDDVNDLGLGRHDRRSLMNRKDRPQDINKPKTKPIPIVRWIKGDDGDARATLTPKKPRLWPPIFIIVVILAEVGLLTAAIIAGGFDNYLSNPMIGPPYATQVQYGAKVTSLVLSGQEWRFISAFVLQQGIIQFLFNLVWQITTCIRVERYWGLFRLAPVYILSGIGGNLLSSVFLPNAVDIGANPCLCGVIMSLLAEVLMNWHAVYAPWKSLLQLSVQLSIFFALGFIPGIDNFLHIGGAFVGFFCSLVVAPRTVLPGEKHAPWWKTAIFVRILGACVVVAYFAILLPILFTTTVNCGWCAYLSPTWELFFQGD